MKTLKRKKMLFSWGTVLIILSLGIVLSLGSCSIISRLPLLFGNGLSWLEEQLLGATVPLYQFTAEGNMEFADCVATAFLNKGDNVYLLVTNATCVADNDDSKKKEVKIKATNFYVSFDNNSPSADAVKQFYLIKIIKVGNERQGENFAILEVKTDKPISVVPLAAQNPSSGEEISGLAVSPSGPPAMNIHRGKMGVDAEGHHYALKMDKIYPAPPPAVPGAAIISHSQNGIVALIGKDGRTGKVVTIPVDKLKTFLNKAK